MNRFLALFVVVSLAACYVQESQANDEITLDRLDLSILSKVQRESKRYPLYGRCNIIEANLRSMLHVKDMDKVVMFEQVIAVLSHKKLPFNNERPVLTLMKECLRGFAPQEPADQANEAVRQEVTAPPSPVPAPEAPQEPAKVDSPLQNKKDEPEQVKNHVKDSGNDVNAGKDSVNESNKNNNDNNNNSNSKSETPVKQNTQPRRCCNPSCRYHYCVYM